jgi:GNAT superfamily N-acetyltransferase
MYGDQAIQPAAYAVVERLRDGRAVTIRAQRPADRAALLAAFERTGETSRYRRFFAAKRGFSEREIAFYMNVDFVGHVALVAELEEGGQAVIAGGARYIVTEPGCAEVSFAVDDPHQGLGIGSRLLRHLIVLARAAGLKTLVAEVLPDNAPMLKVFERSGLPTTVRRETGVVHVTMSLAFRDAAAAGIQPK